MILNVEIKEKRASTLGAPTVVCGNSTYRVKFTFDDEWEGSRFKTARFVYTSNGTVRYVEVPFEGDTVDVPAIANTRELKIGVYAGDLCTSTPARIPCELSIRCGTGAPADLTPNQFDQMLDLVNKLAPDIDATATGICLLDHTTEYKYLVYISAGKLCMEPLGLGGSWVALQHGISMRDQTTGENYNLYIDNHKLHMEVAENE